VRTWIDDTIMCTEARETDSCPVVCVYVCMCVYVCVCVCTCIHTYIYMEMRIEAGDAELFFSFVLGHVCACMHACAMLSVSV
jgi:hypothetical protein